MNNKTSPHVHRLYRVIIQNAFTLFKVSANVKNLSLHPSDPVPPSSLASPPSASASVSQTLTPQSVAPAQEGPVWLSGPVCPEMDAVSQMLHAGLDTKEAREKMLQEIVRMRVKQEEKLATAVQAKRSLQQVSNLVLVKKRRGDVICRGIFVYQT